jgi:hypothetical protein
MRERIPLRLLKTDYAYITEAAREDGESVNHSLELLIMAMRKHGYKSVREAIAKLEKRDVH